jgi:hypothetical protein
MANTINVTAIKADGLSISDQTESWRDVYDMLERWQERDRLVMAFAVERAYRQVKATGGDWERQPYAVKSERFENKGEGLRSPGPQFDSLLQKDAIGSTVMEDEMERVKKYSDLTTLKVGDVVKSASGTKHRVTNIEVQGVHLGRERVWVTYEWKHPGHATYAGPERVSLDNFIANISE